MTQLAPDLAARLETRWQKLGSVGARWSGTDRVAMIGEARAARRGDLPTGSLDEVTTRAVRAVAAHPASIRRQWVDSVVSDGLDHGSYVELVGVVARAVAIDTVFDSLGLEHLGLPEAATGTPTGEIDSRAGRVKAWVPMVGGASITQALSLVPAENAELEHLHGVLYLTFDEMADPRPDKALTRPQMELVAARTSAHNECFY
ncbi:MAG: hypothetical protein WD532_00770 [Acidimicrobiia bacterium]